MKSMKSLYNFFNSYRGQALVELSIWGTIIFMIASVFISYILVLVYRQDLMIRNFVETVRFASMAGSTGTPVMQIAIEHRRLPSLLNIFFPAYKEIKETTSAIWSWNMFWKEHKEDPDRPVTLVKIIMDGKNVSRQLIGPPSSNVDRLLPLNLRGKKNEFLVLSIPPEDEIEARRSEVLKRIENDFGKYSSVYQKVKDWLNKWTNGKNSLADLPYDERQIQIQHLKQILVSAYGAYHIPPIVSSLLNYLEDEKWRGDIDSLASLFEEDYTELDKRSAEVVVNGEHGNVKIRGSYIMRRKVNTSSGSKSYEWSTLDENFSW